MVSILLGEKNRAHGFGFTLQCKKTIYSYILIKAIAICIPYYRIDEPCVCIVVRDAGLGLYGLDKGSMYAVEHHSDLFS